MCSQPAQLSFGRTIRITLNRQDQRLEGNRVQSLQIRQRWPRGNHRSTVPYEHCITMTKRGFLGFSYTAISGGAVRTGCRQSMPSSSMDNSARVRVTVPLSACGQMNRPRSKRLEKRQRPSPSHHRTLIRSPRRPRNTKTCPPNGSCSNFIWTRALSPSKPRRRSVIPAAIQIWAPAGTVIMPAGIPTPRARRAGPQPLRCVVGRGVTGAGSCRSALRTEALPEPVQPANR